KLQPTCEETQAVILSAVGIKTPSIRWVSCNLKVFLMVLSALICELLILTALITKFRFSCSRKLLERLLISSKLLADFFQSHSYTGLALKAFSTIWVKSSFNCGSVNALMSFFCSFSIIGSKLTFYKGNNE